jgi:hypothetical protein
MHETIHCLGFSGELFMHYRAPSGAPHPVVTLSSSLPYGPQNEVKLLGTPTVARAVQAQFNCSTAVGAEIEADGTAGTAGSHWEKRVWMDEIMTMDSGIMHGNRGKLTAVTLALIEDTGWYSADLSKAEVSTWGLNRGCNFIHRPCGPSNPAWAGVGYFCASVHAGMQTNGNQPGSSVGCTWDMKYKGYCTLQTYTSPIPSQFRYFSDPMLGGSRNHDYCPLFTPLNRLQDDYMDGDCTDVANANTYDYTVNQVGR